MAITTRSRSGSLGGFVTWATRCKKYSASPRGLAERIASGASSPMENTGSLASAAMGRTTMRSSSTV